MSFDEYKTEVIGNLKAVGGIMVLLFKYPVAIGLIFAFQYYLPQFK